MQPDDERPVTLKEACRIVFQDAIKPATLRAEAGRGRLEIFRIGKRHFTTLASVKDMVGKCRVDPQALGSISIPTASNGSSETAHISSAQAALTQSLTRLRSSSANTSPANTNRSAARRR